MNCGKTIGFFRQVTDGPFAKTGQMKGIKEISALRYEEYEIVQSVRVPYTGDFGQIDSPNLFCSQTDGSNRFARKSNGP